MGFDCTIVQSNQSIKCTSIMNLNREHDWRPFHFFFLRSPVQVVALLLRLLRFSNHCDFIIADIGCRRPYGKKKE